MLITVNKDKNRIEDTILFFDNHKKDVLEKTWKRVNT